MNRRSMSVAIVDSTFAFSMIDFVQRITSPRVFVLEACFSTHASTVCFSLVEFKVKKMVVVTFLQGVMWVGMFSSMTTAVFTHAYGRCRFCGSMWYCFVLSDWAQPPQF